MGSFEERFWSKVTRSDRCWEWQGPRDHDGYGFIKVMRCSRRAHRCSWELCVGPIPNNLFVLHRCDNPPCVNPAHLFLGTARDNALDMVGKGRAANQRKDHCPQGHEYDEANTRHGPQGDRSCRTCRREWKRRARQRV